MPVKIVYDTRKIFGYQKISREQYDKTNKLLKGRTSMLTSVDHWGRTYDYDGCHLSICDCSGRPRRIVLEVQKEGDLEGFIKFFELPMPVFY